ncbi:hypothetical protein BO70DRAFT_361756 [Aspergillus heteromorphus CBS 117.55]|uniref:Uncharacterized protein n=1 Tax=Aspergillus heteromorphus CBS 117.55 TaxID=1448321 RepID=A0A317W8A8_9EURO|nr:uncharacterized protein BO70DRAFT_361756 [Aspergillus heteromorphus CBS 117.55]PWY82844.1 hypothetical protein BO70DRAFT_361756 [Aspergillus heteromorphus CBS 117.55]
MHAVRFLRLRDAGRYRTVVRLLGKAEGRTSKEERAMPKDGVESWIALSVQLRDDRFPLRSWTYFHQASPGSVTSRFHPRGKAAPKRQKQKTMRHFGVQTHPRPAAAKAIYGVTTHYFLERTEKLLVVVVE